MLSSALNPHHDFIDTEILSSAPHIPCVNQQIASSASAVIPDNGCRNNQEATSFYGAATDRFRQIHRHRVFPGNALTAYPVTIPTEAGGRIMSHLPSFPVASILQTLHCRNRIAEKKQSGSTNNPSTSKG